MAKTGLPTYNTYSYNSFAGETVPLSVTQTSTSVAFFYPASKINNDVIIQNLGPSTAFFAFGLASAGAVTAQLPGTNGTLNATPILAGAIFTMQKQSDNQLADTCAAICASGQTATLYFTSIQGS